MYSLVKSKTEKYFGNETMFSNFSKRPIKTLNDIRKKVFVHSARKLVSMNIMKRNSLSESCLWKKRSGTIPGLRTDSRIVSQEIEKRSGKSCLNLYNDLINHRTPYTVGRTILLKREFEFHGASFFDWINVKKLNKELDNYVANNTWIEYIDSGSFTSVHLFRNITTSELSVLKLQKFSMYDDSSALIHLQEIKTLQKIKHDSIITIFDNGLFRNRYWLILEYADKGNVNDLIELYKKRKIKIDFQTFSKCIINILDGLQFIHNEKIIHRDLKCDNILIFTDNTCETKIKFKIGDFNLSRSITSFSPTMNSYCGTLSTIAPELIGNEPYNHKIDTWSFMCVLIEMAIFRNLNPLSIDTDTLKTRIEHDEIILKVILFIHVKNPMDRPDSTQISHYFKDLKNKTY